MKQNSEFIDGTILTLLPHWNNNMQMFHLNTQRIQMSGTNSQH
jgi:hypothetical protein